MTTTESPSPSADSTSRLASWLGIASAYLLAIGAWIALAVELAHALP